ncbi:Oidioi.mRNA.OKI2018_I69.PAR.g12731.t1.cds [Oikopleura dioica]|uniref:Oidioi.mRNA.OKI2018_I69.PAR.g12731.t1.cds n=1 Tax=Oikopleura dioica TaxID=34765 RepID=A0ABN7S1G2_OIKDI|nr:Oidioi.mRNA.OKI2018_I69.PAR.g12731.t1.cds [Oikopleura dioica]
MLHSEYRTDHQLKPDERVIFPLKEIHIKVEPYDKDDDVDLETKLKEQEAEEIEIFIKEERIEDEEEICIKSEIIEDPHPNSITIKEESLEDNSPAIHPAQYHKEIFLRKDFYASSSQEQRVLSSTFLREKGLVMNVKERRNACSDPSREFHCDLCPKEKPRTFTSMENLWRHFCQHLGHYIFHCDHCEKGFYRKDKLDIHLKNNHPEVSRPPKRYRAPNKSRAFPDKRKLREILPKINKVD